MMKRLIALSIACLIVLVFSGCISAGQQLGGFGPSRQLGRERVETAVLAENLKQGRLVYRHREIVPEIAKEHPQYMVVDPGAEIVDGSGIINAFPILIRNYDDELVTVSLTEKVSGMKFNLDVPPRREFKFKGQDWVVPGITEYNLETGEYSLVAFRAERDSKPRWWDDSFVVHDEPVIWISKEQLYAKLLAELDPEFRAKLLTGTETEAKLLRAVEEEHRFGYHGFATFRPR